MKDQLAKERAETLASYTKQLDSAFTLAKAQQIQKLVTKNVINGPAQKYFEAKQTINYGALRRDIKLCNIANTKNLDEMKAQLTKKLTKTGNLSNRQKDQLLYHLTQKKKNEPGQLQVKTANSRPKESKILTLNKAMLSIATKANDSIPK